MLGSVCWDNEHSYIFIWKIALLFCPSAWSLDGVMLNSWNDGRVGCQWKRQTHTLPFLSRTLHLQSCDPLASWFSSQNLNFFSPGLPEWAELAHRGIRWALVSATGAGGSVHAAAGVGGTTHSLSAGAGAEIVPAVSSDATYRQSHVEKGKGIWRSWDGTSAGRNVWDIPIRQCPSLNDTNP